MENDHWDGKERRRPDVLALLRVKYGHALRLLSPGDLERVKALAVPGTYGKERTIGEPRYRQGGVFAVVEGAVVLYEKVGNKLVRQCHRRRRGDLFTQHHPDGSLDQNTRVQAARDGTVVYSVAWRDFHELGQELPQIVEAMLMVEDIMQREKTDFVVELETCGASVRLMNALYLLATDNPECIVRESQVEIAEEAVISPREVSMYLPELKRRGFVEKKRGQHSMRIPDPQRLLREFRKNQKIGKISNFRRIERR